MLYRFYTQIYVVCFNILNFQPQLFVFYKPKRHFLETFNQTNSKFLETEDPGPSDKSSLLGYKE